MKKMAISWIIVTLLLTGCTLQTPEENASFKVEDNQYLVVMGESESYYVSSENTFEEFSHGKDIGIIFMDEEGNFSIEKSFSAKTGMTAMINGVDISKEMIKINGNNYKLVPYQDQRDNLLTLDSLFAKEGDNEDIKLNPANFEEFVDEEGNEYVIGEEVKEDEVGIFLYPVKLDGEAVYTVTFDKKTGKVFGIKEKATMMKNEEEAKNIKTINYVGIYQYGKDKVVQIDDRYFRLEGK